LAIGYFVPMVIHRYTLLLFFISGFERTSGLKAI